MGQAFQILYNSIVGCFLLWSHCYIYLAWHKWPCLCNRAVSVNFIQNKFHTNTVCFVSRKVIFNLATSSISNDDTVD